MPSFEIPIRTYVRVLDDIHTKCAKLEGQRMADTLRDAMMGRVSYNAAVKRPPRPRAQSGATAILSTVRRDP